MSLEENRSEPLSLKPKTERRNHGQSETQRYASVENFALFLLKGIQSHVKNPRAALILSVSFVTTIDVLCEHEIDRIKNEQLKRKENKHGKA